MPSPQEIAIVLKLEVTRENQEKVLSDLKKVFKKASPKIEKELEGATQKGVASGFEKGFNSFKRLVNSRLGAAAIGSTFGNVLSTALVNAFNAAVQEPLKVLERIRSRLDSGGQAGAALGNIIGTGQTVAEHNQLLELVKNLQALGITTEQTFDLFQQANDALAEVQKDIQEKQGEGSPTGKAILSSDRARGLATLGFNAEEVLQGNTTANVIKFFSSFINKLGTSDSQFVAGAVQLGDIFEKLAARLNNQDVASLIKQGKATLPDVTLEDISRGQQFNTEQGLLEIKKTLEDLLEIGKRQDETGKSSQELAEAQQAKTLTQRRTDQGFSLESLLKVEQVVLSTQEKIAETSAQVVEKGEETVEQLKEIRKGIDTLVDNALNPLESDSAEEKQKKTALRNRFNLFNRG